MEGELGTKVLRETEELALAWGVERMWRARRMRVRKEQVSSSRVSVAGDETRHHDLRGHSREHCLAFTICVIEGKRERQRLYYCLLFCGLCLLEYYY